MKVKIIYDVVPATYKLYINNRYVSTFFFKFNARREARRISKAKDYRYQTIEEYEL